MKLEERLLHLGSAFIWLGVPLACSTRLADAVEVPKSAAFVAGALLVIFAWLLGAARGTWPWLRTGPLTTLWVAVYCWWGASAFWGLGGLNGQIPSLEHFLSLMLLLAWTATGSEERWRVWWWVMLAGGLPVILYAWLQRFGLDFLAWSNPELSVVRTISTMGNPNYLALYLVAWLPLTLPLVAPRRPLWIPWLLGFAALVQTGTRGAWIACLVCLFVALLVSRSKAVLAAGAAMALVGALVVLLGAGVLSERAQASSVGDSDVAARVFLWKAALSIMVEHPFGVGPGGYTYEALRFRHWEPMQKRDQARLPEHPHNEILTVGTDAGWPGAALLVAGVLLFLSGRLKRARSDLTELALLLTGVGLSVHLLTLSLTLPGLVLWLAALSYPGQRARAAASRPPWALVALAGVVWLGGTVMAAGWVRGESDFWWADEHNLQALAGGDMSLANQAIRGYVKASQLVQPQRRAPAISRLASLYGELARRLDGDQAFGEAGMNAWAHAIRLDPRNPYYVAGMADLARRQKGSGEELFRQALRLDPRNPAFWALLGEDQLQNGKTEEAANSYRRSLELYPYHAGAMRRYGEILIQLGRVEEGNEQIERAGAISPP